MATALALLCKVMSAPPTTSASSMLLLDFLDQGGNCGSPPPLTPPRKAEGNRPGLRHARDPARPDPAQRSDVLTLYTANNRTRAWQLLAQIPKAFLRRITV